MNKVKVIEHLKIKENSILKEEKNNKKKKQLKKLNKEKYLPIVKMKKNN